MLFRDEPRHGNMSGIGLFTGIVEMRNGQHTDSHTDLQIACLCEKFIFYSLYVGRE